MRAFEETILEKARDIFDINVIGIFSTIKAALPLLCAQGHGRIISISSVGLAPIFTTDMQGDPQSTVSELMEIVDAENLPLNFILGPLLPLVQQTYTARLQTWKAWGMI